MFKDKIGSIKNITINQKLNIIYILLGTLWIFRKKLRENVEFAIVFNIEIEIKREN